MSFIQLTIIFTLFVGICGHPGLVFRSFFNSLSAEQQQQLKEVVSDPSLTKGQVKEKIEDWVNNSGDEKVKAAFTATKARMEEFKNKAPEMANRLSADAQAVMEQIKAVNMDESLTLNDTCEKVNSIINGASDAVKSEIKFMQSRDCSETVFS